MNISFKRECFINPLQKFIFKKIRVYGSEKSVAKKIGIPISNFNRIKNGAYMPSTILFARMCVELNLSKGEIFELVSDLSEMHRNREIIPRGTKSNVR